MMKKFITIGAVLVLSLSMLTGCGNNTLTTDDEAVSVSGKVSTATAVEVAKVEETATEYVAMEGYIEENTSAFACYDIKIAGEDGNFVQPEGMVEVKIKLPDELASANGSTIVLYVNGENMTRIDCTEADGYVKFKTDHFSIYVVAKYEDGSAIAELAVGTETVIPHVHKYKADEATAVEPTCTEEGKKADTKCSVCGDVVVGETIPAKGHQFGEYVYNDDATTKKDGTETATCSVCGGKDTRTKAGTKIAVSYDGYDEFGNGYVIGADGYKHFDASCPYPINQAVDNGANEIYYYGIYGQPQISHEQRLIMQARYGIGNTGDVHVDTTRIGYYNGQLILYVRIWV